MNTSKCVSLLVLYFIISLIYQIYGKERQWRIVPDSPYIIHESPRYNANPDNDLECQVRLLAYGIYHYVFSVTNLFNFASNNT